MSYVFVADAVATLRATGKSPLIGPYDREKEAPNGKTYTITTEIWRLASVPGIFKWPKKPLSKADKELVKKMSEAERAEFLKLSRFRHAEAEGIGNYLDTYRFALEVMLAQGLRPVVTTDKNASDFAVGQLDIRCKVVTSTTGPKAFYYLFAKIVPSKKAPQYRLAIFNRDPAYATAHEKQVAAWDVEQEKAAVTYGVDSACMALALIPRK